MDPLGQRLVHRVDLRPHAEVALAVAERADDAPHGIVHLGDVLTQEAGGPDALDVTSGIPRHELTGTSLTLASLRGSWRRAWARAWSAAYPRVVRRPRRRKDLTDERARDDRRRLSHLHVEREAPHRRSRVTASSAFTPGPDGTWFAIVDRHEVWCARHRRHVDTAGEDRRRPHRGRRASSAPVFAGTSDARVLRVSRRRRASSRCRRSTPSPGATSWHSVGIPLQVRSMTAHRRRRRAARQRARGRHPAFGRRRRARGRRRSRSTTTCTRCVAHPSRPEIVVAAASVGLCRSTDGGATWDEHDRRHGDVVRARRRRRRRRRRRHGVRRPVERAIGASTAPRSTVDRSRRSTGGTARVPLREHRHTMCIASDGTNVALVDGSGDVWRSTEGCDGFERIAGGLTGVDRHRDPLNAERTPHYAVRFMSARGSGDRMSQTAGIGVVDRRVVVPRTFAWSGEPQGDRLRWFAAGLRAAMLDQGYTEVDTPGPDVAVVLHFVDPSCARSRTGARTRPRSWSRWPSSTRRPTDMLRTGYPLLVRGLANLCVMVSPSGPRLDRTVRDPRAGHVRDRHRHRRRPVLLQERVLAGRAAGVVAAGDRQRVHRPTCPTRCATATTSPARSPGPAQRLAALDLLPAAFPIEEILSDRDLRHVKLLYGIGGLSYGNVSARRVDGRRRVAAAVLDERERRRQVGAARDRPRHPARHRLRRGPRRHAAAACPRASSRAGCRSTPSSTG